MVKPAAALIVLDHEPDQDEVAAYAEYHLENFPADEAVARCELVYEPPAWVNVGEQDQLRAFLRDGSSCILIVYMREGTLDD